MRKSRKSNDLTEIELAKLVLNSKERVESFIEGWMHRHHESREQALNRLEKLGIKLSKLPQEK